MSSKSLDERVGEIVEEAFRRLQKVEDSRHDWVELKDSIEKLYGWDLFMAFQTWQDKRYAALVANDE